MGDRGHVQIVLPSYEEGVEHSIWVYAHWEGSLLPELAVTALERSRGRWSDSGYGARIVVTSLIGAVDGETGWGIDVKPADTGDGGRVVRIDFTNEKVTLITNRHGSTDPMSFADYISVKNRAWPGQEREEADDYDD